MNEDIQKFIKQIIIWKKYKQLLYPDDVLNMMIDCNLIKYIDLEELIKEIDKKPLDLLLPNTYIRS